MKLSKEYLYQKYVLDNQTTKDIANELGISRHTVKSNLRRLGIRKKEFKLGTKIYDDINWLYEQYITLGKGYTVIANDLGVSYTTILDRILFFGWEIRGHNEIDKATPRKGRKHSKESLQKIKESRIRKRSLTQCNNCNNFFERVTSSANRSINSYCSIKCYRNFLKENRVVPDNITFSADYKEWRKKVYKRDNYRCKMPYCESPSRDIAAHHIFPKKLYPDKKFDVQNGITLCRKCHEKTYGKEEQFIEMLVRVVQTMNDL
ncbi:HNH endonuclease [Pseudoneobacillus rhizosphaerae]|uniref:HNH nuclease domain-containing protein n=1 Tax=Pseudoneobacillus rhizosphaerae TaxID=2880968 RepID=A0A9C7GBI6_9BACI|nr:HNH endonuclease [Pseudoneobacillus rhizosphaerae]CAG9609341.1 hypothetical protein NEOCIP111885_03083 [Pseudoneobacillus rhizosphaerae]